MKGEPLPVALRTDADVILARQAAQRLAETLGLTDSTRARLDLVVAEVATNVVRHAGRGVISFAVDETSPRKLTVRCRDRGAGISATSSNPGSEVRGLGLGLAVVRELANELTISSAAGQGTSVEARLWD